MSATERELARLLASTRAELQLVNGALSAAQRELDERDRALARAYVDLANRSTNIDGLKQSLRHAHAACAQAERGARARDDLLSVTSHDLRASLAAILFQAQLLRQGIVAEQKQAAAFEVIERNAKVQAQLIDDLLDAARIVSDRWHMEVQACDLHTLISEVVDHLGYAAEQGAITFAADLDERIGFVWSDPARVRQVATKLVGNAIKFTPPGGRISISLARDGAQAVLRVSDTGAGIAADFLPHVFERLKRLDSSTIPRQDGVGLGLAIVRHVIESLGGTVTVASTGLGQGSTFTASFPITGFDQDAAALEGSDLRDSVHSLNRPGRTRDYGELRGLRVLVLDDEPGTLKAVCDVFRLSGATVCAAASTTQALGLVETFEPQIMICDISMPEDDGYAFIQQLRARGPTRGGDTPALALTALSSAADRRRALAAGYQRHLAKPVDIDSLRDLVVELLRTTRADATLS